MDAVLPPGMTGIIDEVRRRGHRLAEPGSSGGLLARVRGRRRRGGRLSVVSGGRHHAVLRLDRSGFVIDADGRPPLRGVVDILEGERRIDRRLVVCAWAEDGLVGYEFKRTGAGMEAGTPEPGRPVIADYVAPDHAGLLGRD